MFKWMTTFVVISITCITLLSCSYFGLSKDKFKIGLVTEMNSIHDKSFNQSVWEGLTKFGKEAGLKANKDYKFKQSTEQKNYEKNIKYFAKRNYDLVIGAGFYLKDAMNTVSKKYKKTNFAIIDSRVNQPNVVSIVFKDNEGGFLAGVIAALKTKTNKVGFIGGADNEVINRFKFGFMAGAKTINPKIEVISDNINSFNKRKKGSNLAASFYDQGADIIFQAAGYSGLGVFDEAKKITVRENRKVWVIGVDRDQYEEGLPENVTLISIVKTINQAVYNTAVDVKNKEFQGGKTLIYGLKEDGIKLIKAKNNVEDDILKKVDDYKEKIRNGKLNVPATEDEYFEFEERL